MRWLLPVSFFVFGVGLAVGYAQWRSGDSGPGGDPGRGSDGPGGVSSAAMGLAASRDNAISRAVRRVSPAVVSVSVVQTRVMRRSPFFSFFPDEFFRQYYPQFQYKEELPGLGSGFLVDAAIFGFAVGAGFAIFENLYYLTILPDTKLGTWVVRGFGTAIMHGGVVAMFAIISQTLTERQMRINPLYYLPGLAVAILLHSVFNHFLVAPVLQAAGTLILLPPLLRRQPDPGPRGRAPRSHPDPRRS